MGNPTPKKYFYELEARGNELDSYGHVNNAVYLNYAEQARWVLFKDLGLLSKLIDAGKKIVIVENFYKYIRQVKIFDKIIVETSMEKSAHFLLFHHQMINKKSGKVVAKAKVKTVFLNDMNKPCDIPDELKKILEENDGTR